MREYTGERVRAYDTDSIWFVFFFFLPSSARSLARSPVCSFVLSLSFDALFFQSGSQCDARGKLRGTNGPSILTFPRSAAVTVGRIRAITLTSARIHPRVAFRKWHLHDVYKCHSKVTLLKLFFPLSNAGIMKLWNLEIEAVRANATARIMHDANTIIQL